jgi:CRISPR/Cas system CMR-associated protein Cmr3 (group 5 of RAMP superfamily)
MSTHQILLRPTDVLFFRDGRPIEGSLAGHGAAWPLPSVVDAALHAALHRAYPLEHGRLAEGATETTHGDHVHRAVRDGRIREDLRIRRFGSLSTAGPFPVKVDQSGSEETWHFPTPGDLDGPDLSPTSLPSESQNWLSSSLPRPLEYAVPNLYPPSKESRSKSWLTRTAFQGYLNGGNGEQTGIDDSDFFDPEHTVGIAIDPATQTTGRAEAAGKIYSAQYLRLREGWRMGEFATARNGESPLLAKILSADGGHPVIVVGGQQRVCTAESKLISHPPLPTGLSQGFHAPKGKHLVKWVLLTPAIWPEFTPGDSRRGTSRNAHPGGWLPNWIDPQTGAVLLRSISSEQRRQRRTLNYSGQGYTSEHGGASPIPAKLVAALVPKPTVVTGWSLGEVLSLGGDMQKPGAKSTHLAVPAGAVYYFEADPDADGGPRHAIALASALNWHGTTNGTEIKNRRSTLMGEKGFGLGVCGTWEFYGAGGAS